MELCCLACRAHRATVIKAAATHRAAKFLAQSGALWAASGTWIIVVVVVVCVCLFPLLRCLEAKALLSRCYTNRTREWPLSRRVYNLKNDKVFYKGGVIQHEAIEVHTPLIKFR